MMDHSPLSPQERRRIEGDAELLARLAGDAGERQADAPAQRHEDYQAWRAAELRRQAEAASSPADLAAAASSSTRRLTLHPRCSRSLKPRPLPQSRSRRDQHRGQTAEGAPDASSVYAARVRRRRGAVRDGGIGEGKVARTRAGEQGSVTACGRE